MEEMKTKMMRDAPGVTDELPVFKRAEVAKHDTLEKGMWTTFGNGVYDITSFVENHPGGSDKVVLAAGGKLESYWNLYRQHYTSPTPRQHLERMCIGRLHPDDLKSEQCSNRDMKDPFALDPDVSPVMRCFVKKPVNAEPPGPLLTHSYLTPNDIFFIRNHHPVPPKVAKTNFQIDDNEYKIDIEIVGNPDRNREAKKVSISLAELKKNFPVREVVASLQCGGNRREELSNIEQTAGTPWRIGAISTARWEGVYLSDVLKFAGIREACKRELESEFDDGECGQSDYDNAGLSHVQFEGMDEMNASIPTGKAMHREGDVLLAYRMNGDDVPGFHGFPLRVVVPGHAGVRSVKHLTKIRVSPEEAMGTWQRGMAYKGFNPSMRTTDGIEVSKIPSLQEQPVQSAITVPPPGTMVPLDEPLTVTGYAYSGGGRGIVRVDVSVDDGDSWVTAELGEGSEQPLHRAWAWTFFECELPPEKLQQAALKAESSGQPMRVLSKATDASYNVQPKTLQHIWNLRGINNNACHHVTLSPDMTTASPSP